jgi:Bacterial aa3 type cytochrome c oxidase subunit IV
MATPHGSNTTSSNYDIRQSEEAWKNFNTISKWVIIGCVILLAGMALFLTGSHPAKL